MACLQKGKPLVKRTAELPRLLTVGDAGGLGGHGGFQFFRSDGKRSHPHAHGIGYGVQDGHVTRTLEAFRASGRTVRPVLAVRLVKQHVERVRNVIAAGNPRPAHGRVLFMSS